MTSRQVVTVETTLANGDAAYAWWPDGDEPLPVVVLVHGSHVHPRHYSRYASELAAHGFVVVAPEHVRELFGERAHYPQQAVVNWALEWATTESARPESPLHDRVDASRVFVTGHSMGGGVALGIAAAFPQPGLVVDDWQTPEQLVAVVVHGTHNIPPPRTGDPLPIDNQVPLAFVQGSFDGVVTLDQAERTFKAVRGVRPQLMVQLDGANHFYLTDTDTPVGVNADPNRPPLLDQSSSISSAARWTATWFLANAGDGAALDRLRVGAQDDEPHVSLSFVE